MLFFRSISSSGNTPIAVWGTHLDLIQNPQIRAKHGGKEHVNVSIAAGLGTAWEMSRVVAEAAEQLWRLKSAVASRKKGLASFKLTPSSLQRSTGPRREQREESFSSWSLLSLILLLARGYLSSLLSYVHLMLFIIHAYSYTDPNSGCAGSRRDCV